VNLAPLSPDGESVYRAAVERGRLPVSAIAQRLSLSAERAEQVIKELGRHGLVEIVDADLVPLPPRASLEAVATRQAEIAEQAFRTARDLSRLWGDHARGVRYLEMLESDAAVALMQRRQLEEAQSLAQGLISLVRSASPAVAPTRFRIRGGFRDAIGRGVAVQAVYGVEIMRDPEGFRSVQECIRLGEDARVVPGVPVNLVITDRRRAFLTFPGTGPNGQHAVVVHRSGLLDQLIDLFESFWRMAVPISAWEEDEIDEPGRDRDSRRLLACLASGLTDEAIAREFGVSERTVGRRIARLQEILGARSRFQLGVQAARRGWL
jgi:DNA-binding CsgD family transcriptional regulator